MQTTSNIYYWDRMETVNCGANHIAIYMWVTLNDVFATMYQFIVLFSSSHQKPLLSLILGYVSCIFSAFSLYYPNMILFRSFGTNHGMFQGGSDGVTFSLHKSNMGVDEFGYLSKQ